MTAARRAALFRITCSTVDNQPWFPARVRTILTMNDGTEVDVNFVMAERDEEWRVVDIEAEGISYVTNYRS